MKPVVIHTEAESELWQAVDFYEERAPGLGLDFEGEVRRIIARIQEAPKRYPKGKHGTRRCVTRRFPYSVFALSLPRLSGLSPSHIQAAGRITGLVEPSNASKTRPEKQKRSNDLCSPSHPKRC